MADIFISYKKEDHDRVRPLAQALETQGWDVWWDRELLPGYKWRKVIAEELAKARCVIVAWSKLAVESDFVVEEARIAQSNGKLVPVLLDTAEPPLGFGGVQAEDFSNWRGDTDEPPFRRLCSAIQEKLVTPEPAPSPYQSNSSPKYPSGNTKAHWGVRAAIKGFVGFALAGLVAIIADIFFNGSREIDPETWKKQPPDVGYCFQRDYKVDAGQFLVRCFRTNELCQTQRERDSGQMTLCVRTDGLRSSPLWKGAKLGILDSWFIYSDQQLPLPFPQWTSR